MARMRNLDAIGKLYLHALEHLRNRIDNAGNLLATGKGNFEVEGAALNLRIALESLLLSSLVTHQHELGTITAAIRKSDHDQARKRVEKINPDWWPQPVESVPTDVPGAVDEILPKPPPGDWLQQHEWGRAYGVTSDLLHARNPFREPRTGVHLVAAHQQLVEIHGKLVRLLGAHIVQLAGGEYLVYGVMSNNKTGTPHTSVFKRL